MPSVNNFSQKMDKLLYQNMHQLQLTKCMNYSQNMHQLQLTKCMNYFCP